jgi:long-chain acyl-CoA synthetase
VKPRPLPADYTTLAQRYGDSTAIRESGQSLSYRVLAGRAAERLDMFANAGIVEGMRVALVCEASSQTMVSALALLHIGVMIVPFSSETTEAELERAAADCRLQWVVRDGCARAAVTGEALRAIDTDPSRRPALGLLSSGSTGKPKLVLRSADHVAEGVSIFLRSVGLRRNDRIMALVPLEHSYGFNNVFLAALDSGATVIFPGTNHPRAVTDIARSERVTVFPGAPLFFDLMAKFGGGKQQHLPDLRVCVSVGTALTRRVHESFTSAFDVPLWQSYGASEAGPTCLNKTGATDGDVLALGEVCPGAEVSIRDEDGALLPDGETGEIVIRSAAVGLGYEGTHDGASRIEPGCFYTGDLGCMRDGILYFRGRRKLLIAAAGNKIDPVEVENVLLQHPKVADAAVVPHRNDDGSEVVKALLVCRAAVPAVEITDFCSRHLASFKVPRIVEFRQSLPRNAMGKLQRDRI